MDGKGWWDLFITEGSGEGWIPRFLQARPLWTGRPILDKCIFLAVTDFFGVVFCKLSEELNHTHMVVAIPLVFASDPYLVEYLVHEVKTQARGRASLGGVALLHPVKALHRAGHSWVLSCLRKIVLFGFVCWLFLSEKSNLWTLRQICRLVAKDWLFGFVCWLFLSEKSNLWTLRQICRVVATNLSGGCDFFVGWVHKFDLTLKNNQAQHKPSQT